MLVRFESYDLFVPECFENQPLRECIRLLYERYFVAETQEKEMVLTLDAVDDAATFQESLVNGLQEMCENRWAVFALYLVFILRHPKYSQPSMIEDLLRKDSQFRQVEMSRFRIEMLAISHLLQGNRLYMHSKCIPWDSSTGWLFSNITNLNVLEEFERRPAVFLDELQEFVVERVEEAPGIAFTFPEFGKWVETHRCNHHQHVEESSAPRDRMLPLVSALELATKKTLQTYSNDFMRVTLPQVKAYEFVKIVAREIRTVVTRLSMNYAAPVDCMTVEQFLEYRKKLGGIPYKLLMQDSRELVFRLVQYQILVNLAATGNIEPACVEQFTAQFSLKAVLEMKTPDFIAGIQVLSRDLFNVLEKRKPEIIRKEEEKEEQKKPSLPPGRQQIVQSCLKGKQLEYFVVDPDREFYRWLSAEEAIKELGPESVANFGADNNRLLVVATCLSCGFSDHSTITHNPLLQCIASNHTIHQQCLGANSPEIVSTVLCHCRDAKCGPVCRRCYASTRGIDATMHEVQCQALFLENVDSAEPRTCGLCNLCEPLVLNCAAPDCVQQAHIQCGKAFLGWQVVDGIHFVCSEHVTYSFPSVVALRPRKRVTCGENKMKTIENNDQMLELARAPSPERKYAPTSRKRKERTETDQDLSFTSAKAQKRTEEPDAVLIQKAVKCVLDPEMQIQHICPQLQDLAAKIESLPVGQVMSMQKFRELYVELDYPEPCNTDPLHPDMEETNVYRCYYIGMLFNELNDATAFGQFISQEGSIVLETNLPVYLGTHFWNGCRSRRKCTDIFSQYIYLFEFLQSLQNDILVNRLLRAKITWEEWKELLRLDNVDAFARALCTQVQ